MNHLTFRAILISTVFCCLISFPFLNGKLHLVKDIPSTENRRMAKEPVFNISNLDPYPVQYEKFYNDTFSLRSIFVKYYSTLKVKTFKESPLPDLAIIGNNGWLFMGREELYTYKNKDSLSSQQMKDLANELEYRKKYLQERGCRFYIAICPTKWSIYTEYVPYTICRYNKKTTGEQLINYLTKNTDLKLIDLYSPLKEGKKRGEMFYKLDNHWNKLGALYAAEKILAVLHHDMPDVNTISHDDFIVSDTIKTNGNISDMMSGIEFDNDTYYNVLPKSGFKSKDVPQAGYKQLPGFPSDEFEHDREISGSTKLKLLLIGDSFGGDLFPLLSEEFRRSVRIFDAWKYRLNPEVVNAEKPDVCVLLVSEALVKHISQFKDDY